MIKKHNQEILKHFGRIAQVKHSPHEIALGFALGTMLAILPTFGFGIFIGLFILVIYRKISRITLLGSFLVWNPFIIGPLYAASLQLGTIIFGTNPVLFFNVEVFNHVLNYTRRFIVGNLILSTTISLLSYGAVYFIAYKCKKRKKNI